MRSPASTDLIVVILLDGRNNRKSILDQQVSDAVLGNDVALSA